jgi:hypothetical protein
LQKQLFEVLPISLRFANDIYYNWKSNSQADIHQKHKGKYNLIRDKIISRVKELFASNPAKFIDVVAPHDMHSSYHFCVLFSEVEQGGDGFRLEDWQWFAGLLLDASKISPETIIPQIVSLVVKMETFIPVFKENFAKEFFIGRIDDLMAILSIQLQLNNFNPQEKTMINCAQEAAKRWLQKKDKPEDPKLNK